MTAVFGQGRERFELRKGQEGYPSVLAATPCPPETLRGFGDPSSLAEPSLAIVGARRATPYGLGCAALFAGRAAENGIVIVSGGAVGCDQAAAHSALDHGGRTIVVLGGGADVIYPSNAAELLGRVVDHGGAVISERPWGCPPLRPYFVQRNRIIAGLAKATLIVEAGLPSGTFSTADAALDAGREVLAVPGSIHSPQSHGSNRLITQGAQAVVDLETFGQAIADIYGCLVASQCGDEGVLAVPSKIGKEQRTLLEALSAEPMRLERLAAQPSLPRDRFIALISESEAYGLIERGVDGRYHVPVGNQVQVRHSR